VRKTTIEWTYSPEGFFEAPVTVHTDDGSVTLSMGKATAELARPAQPVADEVLERLRIRVAAALLSRQLLIHTEFELLPGHAITQEDDRGGRAIVTNVLAADAFLVGERPDVVITRPDGTVVTDTRAERIATEAAFVDRVQGAAVRSPFVMQLLQSYGRAVADPEDEFVHLYEVRDAISKHYGDALQAQAALGLTEAQWDVLGVLANVEPVEQGRHRGKHEARRGATAAELTKARATARAFIEAVVSRL
jgi:hypothetical protein